MIGFVQSPRYIRCGRGCNRWGWPRCVRHVATLMRPRSATSATMRWQYGKLYFQLR